MLETTTGEVPARRLSPAALAARVARFYLPDGTPRYLRCYDNRGETFDRYTAVFTGRYRHLTRGDFLYLGMSAHPYHPQGFGQHGASDRQIDTPAYGHLGRRIPFGALPRDCRHLVLSDYAELWDAPAPVPADRAGEAEGEGA